MLHVEPLAHRVIFLFGVHLHQSGVDFLNCWLLHNLLFSVLTTFLIGLTDLFHVTQVVLYDLDVHQILLLLLLRLFVGVLLLFDLILMVRHLNVIDELLAFLDYLITLCLLQGNFYLLFLLLLLVVTARLLHFLAQSLGQGAQDRIRQVLQMIAVGGEDVSIEGRARIRLLFSTALGLHFEVIVGASCDLAHLGFVRIRVQVESRLQKHIDAGLLRLRISLSLDTTRVGVHELSLEVHLLADEVRVAGGISYI